MRTAGLNLHVPESCTTKDEFSLMGKQLLHIVMIKLAQVLTFQPHCGFRDPS